MTRSHATLSRKDEFSDFLPSLQITPLAEVVRVLRETSHNGFPIIQQTHGDALDLDGQLVGVMLRHQILLLLEQRAIFEIDSALVGRQVRHGLGFRLPVLTKEQKYLDRLMRVFHHSHHPHRRYLSSRPEAVNETEIVELLPVRFSRYMKLVPEKTRRHLRIIIYQFSLPDYHRRI